MIFSKIRHGYEKVKAALTSTRELFQGRLQRLFGQSMDEATCEELERVFFEADLGLEVAQELTQRAKERFMQGARGEALLEGTRDDLLEQMVQEKKERVEGLEIVLIVGVNGAGKTTSIGKLAKLFKDEGKKVLVASADTFRAAAIEQLEYWTQQVGVDLVKGRAQGDPAAVVYDAVEKGVSRGYDVLLIDTAGRLQNKQHLMQELAKMHKICAKVYRPPHEVWLVLDATTGQNGLDQAKTFHEITPLTGIVLTKLDGSAKGGIVIPIQKTLGLEVRFIGVGERVDDLKRFDPQEFVHAMLAFE